MSACPEYSSSSCASLHTSLKKKKKVSSRLYYFTSCGTVKDPPCDQIFPTVRSVVVLRSRLKYCYDYPTCAALLVLCYDSTVISIVVFRFILRIKLRYIMFWWYNSSDHLLDDHSSRILEVKRSHRVHGKLAI